MNALQIYRKSVTRPPPLYLDYAATTPLDRRVLDEMMPWFTDDFGNPSSVHASGRRARHAVEEARERVASLLGVSGAEIFFCSSGTEADNMAVSSIMEDDMPPGLVTCAAEHKAVLQAANRLDRAGASVQILIPDEHGRLLVSAVRDALSGGPALVSAMHVNNETGVLNPLEEIAALVRKTGASLHSDAVQSAEYYDLTHLVSLCDMVTLSAHKFGGPKGIGLLYARPEVSIGRLIHGGSQERGRRAGTENVPGIIGMAAALERAQTGADMRAERVRRRRDRLASLMGDALGEKIRLTTPLDEQLSCPHILHGLFFDVQGKGLDSEMLVLALDLEGIQVSTGSACTSGAVEPSHVMKAMGYPASKARGALRISLSDEIGDEQIGYAADVIVKTVERLAEGRVE